MQLINFLKEIWPYWIGVAILLTIVLCAFIKFNKPTKFERNDL